MSAKSRKKSPASPGHPLEPVPGIPMRRRRFERMEHCQASTLPVPARPESGRCCRRCRCGARVAAKRRRIPGPERAPFNEIVAHYLKAVGDPREVLGDPRRSHIGRRVEDRFARAVGRGTPRASVWTSFAAHGFRQIPPSPTKAKAESSVLWLTAFGRAGRARVHLASEKNRRVGLQGPTRSTTRRCASPEKAASLSLRSLERCCRS
jgi:hypothetical protein